MPRSRHDNSMLDDTIAVGPQDVGLGLLEDKNIYRPPGRKAVAVIIPGRRARWLLGRYRTDRRCQSGRHYRGCARAQPSGNRGWVMPWTKTDWVLGFEGRSLTNPDLNGWAVKKDKGVFDQFTGATITPRAVVAAVPGALQFAEANKEDPVRRPQALATFWR